VLGSCGRGAIPVWTSSAPALAQVDARGKVTLATNIRDHNGPITITAKVGKVKATYTVDLDKLV
jgi:hypothetical protein